MYIYLREVNATGSMEETCVSNPVPTDQAFCVFVYLAQHCFCSYSKNPIKNLNKKKTKTLSCSYAAEKVLS